MQAQNLSGGFATPAQDAARSFRVALEVLARPGVIGELSGGKAPAPLSEAAACLLLTLCDHETPLYLAGDYASESVRAWVAFHIGAPIVAPAEAMFALGSWSDLCPIDRFAIGTAEYPDRSATLIVEMPDLSATGARLSGPGIAESAALSLPECEAFQANAALFPLGVDFFFTSAHRVAGLPRSTKVEAE